MISALLGNALLITILLMAIGILLIILGSLLPGWWLLLFMGIGIFLVYSGAFVIGFAKFPDGPDDTLLVNQLLALFFFGSALAWGVSVIGDPTWNSWFNFFAAGFAMFAAGYATPQNILG